MTPKPHWPSWLRSLVAVLAGNLIYFATEHWMPSKAQHQPFVVDWGLAVDFWICVACWGLLRFVR